MASVTDSHPVQQRGAHKWTARAVRWWERWGALLLAVLFTLVTFIFLVNKHNAFNTRTYDFGRFDQAIWNTLNGRFLFSSIDYRSILGNHFSPYMALLAPLFLIWPDERLLFLVQAAGVAVGGLFLYLIMRRRYAALAPWFLLAFYLNPALHEMVLFEFRRVTLAFPYLALALYAVDIKKRWLMLAALLIALLCKEDIGLFVFGVGLFVLIVQHDWRWGLGLLLLGFGWSVVVTLWVIPAFRAPGSEYPQLFYFSYLGNSYSDMFTNLRADPLIMLRQLFSLSRLQAVGRLLLPAGFFLPFLGGDWLLILLPPLLLLLLSGDAEMFGLQKWYVAAILPVLFTAVAVGVGRLQRRRARWATMWLLVSALLGYLLFSPLPGGGRYEAPLYAVSEHDRLSLAVVTAVPPDASIATQPHYVPHLAHRELVFHYPWIKIGAEQVDYFLFDRHSSPYPFSQDEIAGEITQFLADPQMQIVAEADGIYLFKRESAQPNFVETAVADAFMQFNGFDVAVQQEDDFYRVVAGEPPLLSPGQNIRIDLFWEALAAADVERTVSVRLTAADGFLQAQHDGVPGQGSKPTSWWRPGWQVRDVHYLTLPEGLPPGGYALELVVYDSFSQAVQPFAGQGDTLLLSPVEVIAP